MFVFIVKAFYLAFKLNYFKINFIQIMRIWDIKPKKLCRSHLLGMHRELHAIWNILTKNKKGYANHPEVLRWRGKLRALYLKHEEIVKEMLKRGYKHHSPLERKLAKGGKMQNKYWQTVKMQKLVLKNKKCGCLI